tara:strand:- start:1143 stop:2126 length:984 start_codon:yes stop_codon:yes gene_type:complete
MERILAASIQQMNPNGTAVITLQADQGQELQINRLVIQVGSTLPGGAGGGNSGASGGMASQCFVQNILVRNTTSMIRGQVVAGALPLGVPLGTWSAYRAFTGVGQFARRNGALRLEAGETVVITINNVSDLGGYVMAACPTVLDCDKGRPAYSGGWSASDGAAVLAAPIGQAFGSAGFFAGGSVSNPINSGLAWPEAGIVDLSNLVGALSWNTSQPYPNINEPLGTPLQSFLTQMTLIDASVIVTGLATPGAPGPLAVPLSLFWGNSGGQYREAPWVRLPNQSGTSGNVVQITTQCTSSNAPGNDAFAGLSAPFYPSIGSKPPIGCI